jgi:hypothetical protein
LAEPPNGQASIGVAGIIRGVTQITTDTAWMDTGHVWLHFPRLLRGGHSQITRKNLRFWQAGRGGPMLRPFGNRADAGPATMEADSVARRSRIDQTSEELSELEASEQRALSELAVAERLVPEINACVDRQRQLIKQLASAGKDVTSAQIMLDSLVVSLFLAAEDRHRLRAMLNAKEDSRHGLRGERTAE